MRIGKAKRDKCLIYLNTNNKTYLTGKYCLGCGFKDICGVEAMGKKVFNIEAKVKIPTHSLWSVETMISDMLRYDIMKIVKKSIDGDYAVFNLTGNVRYTKARWDSFGIKTKEIV
jgi:hypothetical protein